jgi:hypothetical protein
MEKPRDGMSEVSNAQRALEFSNGHEERTCVGHGVGFLSTPL